MREKVFANERGEFEITIGGEEKILRYSFGALKELERHFKVKGPQALLAGMPNWSTDDHIVFIRAGLTRGSDPDITVAELEDLLTLDRLKYYIETIASAILGVTDSVAATGGDEENPT